MRATIRQVAELAGVSRTTVSNVLLGREGRITPEKRDHVLRAVEKLRYVPVRTSLQNRQPRTRVLAMAIEHPHHIGFDFHSKVYTGICEAALRNDYDVLTVLRPDPDWAVNRAAVRLLDGRSDGILVFPTEVNDNATLTSLVSYGTPVVALFRRDVPEGVAWIDPDNEGAVIRLVNLLAAAGHRKVAHLTYFLETQYDFHARSMAFEAALGSAGLEALDGGIVVTGSQVSQEAVDQILRTKATAVVCGNDWLAFRLWDELEKRGVRVPEDISLTGIDNQQLSERGGLTTMGFTYEEVGNLAVEALMGLLAGKEPTECSVVVPLRLYERNSVASQGV
jgi:LacI family transcriptional regulator